MGPIPPPPIPAAPPPWFLRGPHRQTLGGHFLPGARLGKPQRRHFIPVSDGDLIVLHENLPLGWKPGDPLLVLVHGLTGSHRSGTIERLARLAVSLGIGAMRLDLRGAGDGFRLARKSYNGGCSDDLAAALTRIAAVHPDSPYAVLGVSLGGNIVLRLAGSLADRVGDRFAKWRALGAMNPPVDLGACCALLEHPGNRLYEKQFLTELWNAERDRRKLHPGLAPLGPGLPATLREFDERVTAPAWGFAHAEDYYRWGSSAGMLGGIELPGWVLTARDDPFIDPSPLERLGGRAGRLEVDIVDHGGHLGYLMWKFGPSRWAEPAMIQRLAGLLAKFRA